MSIQSWFSRSLGRVREGTKAHLVSSAELLDFTGDVLHAMREATDDECEALFVEHVSRTCGGTVDWREQPQDIADTLAEFLSADEASLIQASTFNDRTGPPQAIQGFDESLKGSPRGVRALESFGDFYIVLVLPRHLLPRFDEINQHWIAAGGP
ncbi:hypothetical protein [Hydrogenophaga sp.]|uniref:hypothetical protein n=1 Tax=Hydrogenophaga sp. TaxID=1904254 RepID=UPI002FC9AD36